MAQEPIEEVEAVADDKDGAYNLPLATFKRAAGITLILMVGFIGIAAPWFIGLSLTSDDLNKPEKMKTQVCKTTDNEVVIITEDEFAPKMHPNDLKDCR